jgi:hypothetical protein
MKNGKIKPTWTVSTAAYAHMLLAPKHKRNELSGCRSDSIVVLVEGEVVVDESAVEVSSSNGCSSNGCSSSICRVGVDVVVEAVVAEVVVVVK